MSKVLSAEDARLIVKNRIDQEIDTYFNELSDRVFEVADNAVSSLDVSLPDNPILRERVLTMLDELGYDVVIIGENSITISW